jgi:hypothetical protein
MVTRDSSLLSARACNLKLIMPVLVAALGKKGAYNAVLSSPHLLSAKPETVEEVSVGLGMGSPSSRHPHAGWSADWARVSCGGLHTAERQLKGRESVHGSHSSGVVSAPPTEARVSVPDSSLIARGSTQGWAALQEVLGEDQTARAVAMHFPSLLTTAAATLRGSMPAINSVLGGPPANRRSRSVKVSRGFDGMVFDATQATRRHATPCAPTPGCWQRGPSGSSLPPSRSRSCCWSTRRPALPSACRRSCCARSPTRSATPCACSCAWHQPPPPPPPSISSDVRTTRTVSCTLLPCA